MRNKTDVPWKVTDSNLWGGYTTDCHNDCQRWLLMNLFGLFEEYFINLEQVTSKIFFNLLEWVYVCGSLVAWREYVAFLRYVRWFPGGIGMCYTIILKILSRYCKWGNEYRHLVGSANVDPKWRCQWCIMIPKLTAYVIAGDSWNWFCSYSMFSAKVKQQNISQSLSILGPLLFTLYVNDFPEGVDNAVGMYADDSTLQAHAKDI